jgi:hypothetical protein
VYCRGGGGGGVTRHAHDTHTATPRVCSSQHTHRPSSSPTFTSLSPVLPTPRHALWHGPPVTSSPHTLTQRTHPLRSSRTLSTQACSSQATLNTICSTQISNNSLLLTSFTFTVCSSQTGRATQLAPHKRTYTTHTHTHTHTHHFTHSTTSNTTSPPTPLPSSSPVSHSTPRLREPLLS